jgi:SAM-dependent methyltransferase
MGLLSLLLSHPLTRGLDIDDAQTTELRKQIILKKPFLRKIYKQWYSHIKDSLPLIAGPVLELGTGAGFLKNYITDLVASDIMPIKESDLTCNALQLPFAANSLRAIVMINVLHHMPDADVFFQEGHRCIKNKGVMIMIEPWVSTWSQIVYSNFHHEPFDPGAKSWKLPPSGPLSGGNDALPWIIFNRDIEKFKQKHSYWTIKTVALGIPLNYLLSGGVSMRNLVPGWMYTPLAYIEKYIPDALMRKTAMFSMIILANVK